MKAKRRGSRQVVKGRLYGLFWLGGEKRASVPVPGVNAADAAAVNVRCELIADLSSKLIAAGRTDRARDFATMLGEATSAKRVEKILKTASKLIEAACIVGPGITVRQFGTQWTSEELHRAYPDHVKTKRTAKDDDQILRKYIYPIVGDTAVKLFHLEDGERVMAGLPRELSVARRRHVAQVMHRMFSLAIYPAKVIERHPLPRGFLPKLGPAKAKQYLYPDEDEKLMKCTAVPFAYRLLYGVCDREGFRFDEARMLEWSDLDLDRGAVSLDENKTDEPRSWALDPGVVQALRRWKQLRPRLLRPFEDIPTDEHQADRFRFDVAAAGVTRQSLFERSKTSMRLRFHDLRATFVTVSLANGKSETWVSDRTGHKSSHQIAKYQRAARTLAELNMGPLKPLAISLTWEEDPGCQTCVKRGRVDAGPLTRRSRKDRLRTEGGTRTLTPFRTADFESDLKSSKETPRGRKRGGGHEPPIPSGTFDRGLTDLGEIHRQWSSFETVVETMVSGSDDGLLSARPPREVRS